MQPGDREDRISGPAPDLVRRLRFDAGRLCLNLLATVGRRGAVPVERLPTPRHVADWLVDAGLLDTPVPVEEHQREQLCALREAACDVLEARRRRQRPDADAVTLLNRWASQPTAVPRLAADGASVAYHSRQPVAACLATLARDTISLASGPEMGRVRACAAPECRMLFLDHSRGTRRRWCSMSRCGNRAKARTHASKTRAAGQTP